jgi:hypothetical protein
MVRAHFHAEVGDWILRSQELILIDDPAKILADDEIVVPHLDRLIRRLGNYVDVAVVDCSPGDFACLAFDADGHCLANVVADNPEEAVLRVLLAVAESSTHDEPER